MLAPILVCPVIFAILRLAYVKSKSYKYKPRFKKYSMAFLCEWLFTFVLFSTYNIIISLVINVESLGISDPISLAIASLTATFPIIVILSYAKFNKQY